MNCSVSRFDKIYESAMSRRIQFVIVGIDGHDLDSVRNYHLKFMSQKDLNDFKKVCK